MASASGQRLSRDEYKKQKELEEARKSGAIPAELDEDGKEINPHIPQYIAQAPWYVNASHPTLSHQRLREHNEKKDWEWYRRGEHAGHSTKYRKGACENCGAMTHIKKFCLERPRKVGAKYTNKNIAPDELIQDIKLDFEAKRDRWNGYDPAMFKKVVDEYEKTDQYRRQLKQKELNRKFMTEPDPSHQRFPNGKGPESGENGTSTKKLVESNDAADGDSDSGSDVNDNDDIKQAEDYNPTVTKKDPKSRAFVRNLRIREDTAKYLRNLDPNSAYYDPKTRSMRENPTPDKPPEELTYAGDNFYRITGDAVSFNELQAFAFKSFEDGGSTEIHPQAVPSMAAKIFIEKKNQETEGKEKRNRELLSRYGGQEYSKSLPRELLLQTENYVEYSADGRVIKGLPPAVPKSKYEEDVLVNNHTSVWGSFWQDGQWGYACCHQFVKNSYCTGEAGKQINAEQRRKHLGVDESGRQQQQQQQQQPQQQQGKSGKAKLKTGKPVVSSDLFGTEVAPDVELDQARLREALRAADAEQARNMEHDERKRKYNSLAADLTEATPEMMEAYRLKRTRADDPMANFVS